MRRMNLDRIAINCNSSDIAGAIYVLCVFHGKEPERFSALRRDAVGKREVFLLHAADPALYERNASESFFAGHNVQYRCGNEVQVSAHQCDKEGAEDAQYQSLGRMLDRERNSVRGRIKRKAPLKYRGGVFTYLMYMSSHSFQSFSITRSFALRDLGFSPTSSGLGVRGFLVTRFPSPADSHCLKSCFTARSSME